MEHLKPFGFFNNLSKLYLKSFSWKYSKIKANIAVDISPPIPYSLKVFPQILSFQVCVARHVQITLNNKFAISLQHLKKEVSDEVDFLHTGRHESLLQTDAMILMGMVKHSHSSQKKQVCNVFTISQKRVRDEVDFLHVDKHQSFLQVDFNTLGIKASCKVILSLLLGIIKHSQSTQSNKSAISLYLYL